MSHSLITVSAGDEGEARRLALGLVTARLAAAVNILPRVSSFYWWGGEVCESEEAVLLIKTRRDLIGQVVAWIKARHDYDCPSILAVPIEAGNQDYLDWIDRETRGQGG